MATQRCPNCGKTSSADNRNCPACGAKLTLTVGLRPQYERPCWSCGQAVDPSAAFCPSCGAPQNRQVDPPQSHGLRNALLICGGVLALIICANTGRSSDHTSHPPATTAPSSGLAVAARTPTPRPTLKPTLPPLGMSRSRPLPLGQTIEADNDIQLKVLAVDRGEAAWAKIHDYNSWNHEPDEGMEYVLVLVALRLNRDPDDTQRISASYFRVVGERGAIREEPFGLSLGREFAPELFGGGSCEGEVAFQVEQGEGDLVLIYSGSGTEARFLALEE